MSISSVVGTNHFISSTQARETNDTYTLDNKIQQLKKQIEQVKKNEELPQQEKDKRIANIESQVVQLEQQNGKECSSISSIEKKKRFDTYEAQTQQQSAGVYRVTHDEQGKQIIEIDKSLESVQEQLKHQPQNENEKPNNESQKPTIMKTTGNTDKVDREIEKLKQTQSQLEQKIAATKEPKEKESLEMQLAQVEAELNLKDNDTYRRQHMEITEQKVVSRIGE